MHKKSSEELIDLILAGKSKSLEFCDENIDDATIAKHLVAFANAEGGSIIFGIDDDSKVVGLMSSEIGYRIADIAANMLFPVINPEYYEVSLTGKVVGIVKISEGSEKPYYYSLKGRHNYMIRAGKTSRKISPNQLQSFLKQGQKLRYELSPVRDAKLNDLDEARLSSFLQISRGVDMKNYKEKDFHKLLTTMDILTSGKNPNPTVAGLLLFGKNPEQFLAQARISVVLFSSKERNQESVQMEVNKALLPVQDAAKGEKIANGAIEEIVLMIADQLAEIHEKESEKLVPVEVLKELVLNALIHRDYTDIESNISIEVFTDHLEITSPGTLSNEITMDKIMVGQKATRNPLLYNYLAEVGYVNKNSLSIFDLLTKRNQESLIKRFEFEPLDKAVRISLFFA